MNAKALFQGKDNTLITGEAINKALHKVGATDTKVIYMHTGLSFGKPNPNMSRAELLEAVYQAIRCIGVKTLCVPTFTFSFCNGQEYDVVRSKSQMGALNEYVRRQHEATRSCDPLMSVAVVGEDKDLAENLGQESIGTNSTFNKLSRRDDVKFLFLGVSPGDCFTYMHYLEWLARVPYRYDRAFSGRVVLPSRCYQATYNLFVRYHNVHANVEHTNLYVKLMRDRGVLVEVAVGDNVISCVRESDARILYLELLNNDPDFFIEKPFRLEDADRTFVANNMVAL